DSPAHRVKLVVAVPLDRQPAQQAKPAPPLQIVTDSRQLRREPRQRKVLLPHLTPAESTLPHPSHRRVHLGDRPRGERMDPITGSAKVTATPHKRTGLRALQQRIHRTLLPCQFSWSNRMAGQVASQTRREGARNARRTLCTLSVAGALVTKYGD